MSDSNPVVRIESDGLNGAGLSLWPAMDPSDLVSGTPVEHGHLYDEIEDIDYSVGVWDCTAFDDKPGPYPVDEYMLLLSGSVEMVMPDGGAITVNAGDVFVIPKGLECQWKMPGTVRKIFMILDGADVGNAQNYSLERITLLRSVFADAPSNACVSTRQTLFVNHDGKMQTFVESFGHPFTGARETIGRQIVTVLNGQVGFSGASEDQFVKGDSFYLRDVQNLKWAIAAGTTLIVAQCHL